MSYFGQVPPIKKSTTRYTQLNNCAYKPIGD